MVNRLSFRDKGSKNIRVAIFGAGQAGQMLSTWLPYGQELVCYMDNNKEIRGSSIDGIPVLSLRQGLRQRPNIIYLAVLNRQWMR